MASRARDLADRGMASRARDLGDRPRQATSKDDRTETNTTEMNATKTTPVPSKLPTSCDTGCPMAFRTLAPTGSLGSSFSRGASSPLMGLTARPSTSSSGALSAANRGKTLLPRLCRAVSYVDSAFDVDPLLLIPRTLRHLDVQHWDEVYGSKHGSSTKMKCKYKRILTPLTSRTTTSNSPPGIPCGMQGPAEQQHGMSQPDAHRPVKDERAAPQLEKGRRIQTQ
ncbi:uncharacterized protein B0H18DRAFT_961567 [Fomitopsis serialis]|uniref:uncharacterized protein n=1 Tax=Fomitopsis serialis TaxID=139415 RepID=UPI002007D4AB|nr:uncharacterized protein B0H18DRAFT_961567 [Neoantrodia serialis]KAH9911882.1 hypothetical protein B0H18DRAFT_961567 [Neoantrodia serialis]